MEVTSGIKVQRIKDPVAAGTSDQTTDGVDRSGFDSVLFLCVFGTITGGALTSIKVQQSEDDGATDAYSDLAGSSITVADTDDDKVAMVEVVGSSKKWLRLYIDRGAANAVVDSVLAISSFPHALPVTPHADQVGAEVHQGPVEGTA